MKSKSVKLIYFSPTGTTEQVLKGIAEGLAFENVETFNLTAASSATQSCLVETDDLVVIGAPVYSGRIPTEAIRRIEEILRSTVPGTPVVLVAVYGNREFEDALLELKILAIESGFQPIAAAGFIGEHSFATSEKPIATGRPDALDLEKAVAFGEQVKRVCNEIGDLGELKDMDLHVPGNFPHRDGVNSMEMAPETEREHCSLCGECVDVCPTDAITMTHDSIETDKAACIRCSACIKVCSEEARIWTAPGVLKATEWLYENCGVRKEPVFFL